MALTTQPDITEAYAALGALLRSKSPWMIGLTTGGAGVGVGGGTGVGVGEADGVDVGVGLGVADGDVAGVAEGLGVGLPDAIGVGTDATPGSWWALVMARVAAKEPDKASGMPTAINNPRSSLISAPPQNCSLLPICGYWRFFS